MKLIAGSLNVEVDGFLHAGYLSAYPRSFDEMGPYQIDQSTAEVVDVAAALVLKLEHSSESTTSTATLALEPVSLPTASLATSGMMVGIAVLFFAWLTAEYFRRYRKIRRPRWVPWVLMPSLVLVLIVIAVTAIPVHRAIQKSQLNNLPPPWTDVVVREYEDPELATVTILRSLVAPGLANCPVKVSHLTAIQREVAFPVPDERITEGMAYALTTYGLDGWGREFSFARRGDGSYRIASNGPDGEVGTEDDIAYTTPPPDGYNWEPFVNGVFVRNVGSEDVFLIRRVAHRLFRPANATEARELTGTDMFDVFDIQPLVRQNQTEPPVIVVKLSEFREIQVVQSETNSTSFADPLLFIYLPRRET